MVPMLSAQRRAAACKGVCECGHPDCATGYAQRGMTRCDWFALGFYNRIADQWDNQAPMGTKDGKTITAFRMEAVEAALRIFDYDRELWPWLVSTARVIAALRAGERPAAAEFVAEYGKLPRELIPEEM